MGGVRRPPPTQQSFPSPSGYTPTDTNPGRLAPDGAVQAESEGLAEETLFWAMHRLGLVT